MSTNRYDPHHGYHGPLPGRGAPSLLTISMGMRRATAEGCTSAIQDTREAANTPFPATEVAADMAVVATTKTQS